MHRATRLTLAMGLPIAAIVAAGQHAAASAPTDPPSAEAGTLAGETVTVTDDTGTITVDVPATWTDVATAPDGGRPFIEAAPDRAAYNGTFTVPGVTYIAAPFSADTEAATQQFGLTSGCASEETQSYDDGAFAGTQLVYSQCGGEGSSAEFHVIAANPQNQAFTALLRIQITGPDETPILQGILDTFNMTPAAVAGTTTVPGTTTAGASTTTSAPGGAFPMPTGEIPADWTPLTDDTGSIAIDVPSTWTAIDLAPAENEDGSAQPWISATTDQALFFPAEGTTDTFSVPGVIYRAIPYEADTAARLAASVYNDECTPQPMQSYDDGVFAGHIQSFESCAGTQTRILQVAASPADGSFTASLLIQLTGLPDDDTTLNGLLLSFNVAAGPTTGPATTVAGPTTTVAAPTTTVAAPTTTAAAPTTTSVLDRPSG
jgi:hypothetical protein